jgi:hypothetical protein
MLHSGTCPKCGKIISHAKIEAIDLSIGRTRYKGISYLCPSCRAVLSVSLDHVALVNDVAQAVARRLGKG